LLGVSYATYLYATTIGTQNGLITTGAIGGVLVKLTFRFGAQAPGFSHGESAFRCFCAV
jgi:hypothetical protein